MESDISSILVEVARQAPVLTIVLIYLYKNNNEWRTYLRERNGKTDKALEKLASAVDRFHERLDSNG